MAELFGFCISHADNGSDFGIVVADTVLKHEEHTAAGVAVGDYLVIIQTEYTPQELRQVAD